MTLEELEIYIKQCKKEKKYIDNIDQINEIFNKENIDYTKRNKILKEIYIHNNILYKQEKAKEEELKKIKQLKQIQEIEEDISEQIKEEAFILKEQKVKNIDISFYLDQILECKDLEDIDYFLPNYDSEDYEDIINFILLYFAKEKIEIAKLIFSESENMEKEELEDFKKELKYNEMIFKKILEYKKLDIKNIINVKNIKRENNILYLYKNNNENNLLLTFEKTIDREFYDDMKILLTSIIDGTFKNAKSFKIANKKDSYILEVKLHSSRITFKRINKDTFVILDAFIKKVDSNSKYLEDLNNKLYLYNKEKERLKILAKNEDYLNEQKQQTQEILNYLSKDKRKRKK